MVQSGEPTTLMKLETLLLVACLATPVFAGEAVLIANPLVDFAAHRKAVFEVEKLRSTRVVSEAEFLRLTHEPGTIVLDARSNAMFQRLHLKGAVNLTFPEFSVETLAKVIPMKTTRVLIYCNNNFKDSPDAFPVKNIAVALNSSTYVALHAYGYDNIYELGPLLEVKTTKLPFEGESLETPRR